MPTWNSRGLRGSTLEDLINMSNDKYRTSHLALVQKIPTPIKPINIDQSTRHITLAYFDQKSTVYKGILGLDNEYQPKYVFNNENDFKKILVISFEGMQKYKEINQNFRIYANQGIPVHYLQTIQKDIELR